LQAHPDKEMLEGKDQLVLRTIAQVAVAEPDNPEATGKIAKDAADMAARGLFPLLKEETFGMPAAAVVAHTMLIKAAAMAVLEAAVAPEQTLHLAAAAEEVGPTAKTVYP
jgi:hypothetical protein